MNRESQVIENRYVKPFFIYVAVILLGGLFLSAIVEGIRNHFAGDSIRATILYIAGFGALIAAFFIYRRGKTLLEALI